MFVVMYYKYNVQATKADPDNEIYSNKICNCIIQIKEVISKLIRYGKRPPDQTCVFSYLSFFTTAY